MKITKGEAVWSKLVQLGSHGSFYLNGYVYTVQENGKTRGYRPTVTMTTLLGNDMEENIVKVKQGIVGLAEAKEIIEDMKKIILAEV